MARNIETLRKQYYKAPTGRTGGGHGPGGGRPSHGKRPKNSGAIIGRLWGYLKQYPLAIVAVLACSLIYVGATLYATYQNMPILNTISNANPSGDPNFVPLSADERGAWLVKILLILLVLYVVSTLVTYLIGRIMIEVSQRVTYKIRRQTFDKMQTLPARFFDSQNAGELMSRFTNDIDNIGAMIDQSLTNVMSGILTILGMAFIMFFVNWILALIVIIFVPLFVFIGAFVSKRSGKYFVGQQSSLGALNGYIEESMSGQKVVKVFNHEDVCIEEFGLLNEDMRGKMFKAQFFGGVLWPIVGNLSQITYAVVGGVGGILCIKSGFTIGGLALFALCARQFSRPINEFSQQMNTIFSALAGAERVFAILDENPESANTENSDAMPEMKGFVKLDNVGFGYVPEKRVLKNITLYAKPGQKIAFVGSTGAGKTTITNLLNRFYDVDEGSITIDGVDVRDIERDILRKNIAMVLQDTHLFTGTIRENIRYGRLDATDDEVEQAARTASAHSFIMRLEHGYDTVIEGDGANLSQGQRQLLNIARAAISNAPILVLDEATSSVDTRTERHIEHGMDRLMKNRTTFVIAHRLSTVRNSNAIMVLEKGEIIERGTHEQLLELKGRYHQLYTGAVELD